VYDDGVSQPVPADHTAVTQPEVTPYGACGGAPSLPRQTVVRRYPPYFGPERPHEGGEETDRTSIWLPSEAAKHRPPKQDEEASTPAMTDEC